MKILKIILSTGAIVAGSAAVFIYLGIYPPGADEPHSAVVHRILQVSRDRAIAVRADGLNVPDLGDAAMIRQGSATMQPCAAAAIWGKSIGDTYIWGLVAFLKAMPAMTPAEYREMVEAVSHHHDQESPVDHVPGRMPAALA